MLDASVILVSTRRGADRAEVRRDRQGEFWLCTWPAERPERVAAMQLPRLHPGRIGGDGWWAFGGQLPDGAVSAEVRDISGGWHQATAANNAWVAFRPAKQPDGAATPPLRCLDATGALVSRAASYASVPTQALDPALARLLAQGSAELGGTCPVCGQDDWRTTLPRREYGQVIFCGACGHSDRSSYGFISWTPKA